MGTSRLKSFGENRHSNWAGLEKESSDIDGTDLLLKVMCFPRDSELFRI